MTLALIAGRGRLPAEVAAAQDVPPLVCGYEGTPPEGLDVDLTFRLETLGTLLVQLGEKGVTRVCFCGGIDRPQLDPSKLDAETMALVPLFQKALAAGDNGALQILKEIFEQTGFEVLGADELLPDLIANQGFCPRHGRTRRCAGMRYAERRCWRVWRRSISGRRA
ncbi:hypothetical protein [Sulfitobacter sediminilitoris]|uniref:hypothetical protein n=1 Tax=Sulfitobacter sediminilitoris TaxID=2698830 RepID=UPI003616DBC9